MINELTKTQNEFIDYINENICEHKSIILYERKGHIGADFALQKRFKKAKILTIEQLRVKKRSNIIFRIGQILGSIITFFIKKLYDVDAVASTTNIINNIENLYLGLEKEKEFLKCINVRRKPHKLSKIKYIVRLDHEEISNRNLSVARKLIQLANSGRVNHALLIVAQRDNNLLNLENHEVPTFQLTETDVEFIMKRKLIPSFSLPDFAIVLTQNLGINFCLDNYSYLNKIEISSNNSVYNFLNDIVSIIMNENKLTAEMQSDLYRLLEFSSFFNEYFTKLDINKFQNNAISAENVDIAYKLSFLKELNFPNMPFSVYAFLSDFYKEFFYEKYSHDLYPLPSYIFKYFKSNYPFEFETIIKIIKIDNSLVSFLEKESYIVLEYYQSNKLYGKANLTLLTSVASKDSVSSKIMILYENFKEKTLASGSCDIAAHIYKQIKTTNILNEYAKCAVLTLLLQICKEDFIVYKKLSFTDLLLELKNQILKIDKDSKDTLYNLYWINHFKEQYIALSLEDEKTGMKTSRLFLCDIQKCAGNLELTTYIQKNNLRNFDRIKLLSNSLSVDNSTGILQELFDASETSSLIKELARLNLSAAFLEEGKYEDARKLLNKGEKTFYIGINKDTYHAYINNYLLAQYKTNRITQKEYRDALKKLTAEISSFNDDLIIKLNLNTVYLQEAELEKKGVEGLDEIIRIGNPYNRFLAVHNLLGYYFKKHDKVAFAGIYKMVKIPKLFKSMTTFFERKFLLYEQNFDKAFSMPKKKSENIPSIYYDIYLFGTLERWFE